MNSNSSRHHYLPKFYVKNFCDEKGKIFINDKSNSADYDNITSKVPKSIFFEWDRNTFSFEGKYSDSIEKIYSDLDNNIAKIIKRLMDDEALPGRTLNVETLRNLIFFGYLIKWRVPRNDDYVEQLKESITFERLNLYGAVDNKFIDVDNFLSDDISQEFKRILFSGVLFRDSEQYAKVFKNTFIVSFREPLFVTDNPFVELEVDTKKEFPSFIFPITSNLLLVYCDFIEKEDFVEVLKNSNNYEPYNKTLYNAVQLTLMWHAHRYIGCESKEHLAYYLSIVSGISDKLGEGAPFVAFNILNQYDKYR